MNSVTLMGRLGSKPEIRRVGNDNTPVVEVSIATYGGKDRQGEKITDWHDLTFWGHQAELVSTLGSGDQVLVQGKIKTDKWTTTAGEKRKKTYVRVMFMEMCGSKRERPTTGAVGPASNPYGDDNLNF